MLVFENIIIVWGGNDDIEWRRNDKNGDAWQAYQHQL
jgi:hypothetical protein